MPNKNTSGPPEAPTVDSLTEQLEAVKGELKDALELSEKAIAARDKAQTELKDANAKVKELETSAGKPSDEINRLLETATQQLQLKDAQIAALQNQGDPLLVLSGLCKEVMFTPRGPNAEPKPLPNVKRFASMSPWLFVETIGFMGDSGYDNNFIGRAKSSLDRAFDPARLSRDGGVYKALPDFNEKNRIVIAVAVLAPSGEDLAAGAEAAKE
jgi:exonuclease VII small subunit